MYVYTYICTTREFRKPDICLRNCCRSAAENCGDLRRPSFPLVKGPTNIADICGDDECAQNLCGKI